MLIVALVGVLVNLVVVRVLAAGTEGDRSLNLDGRVLVDQSKTRMGRTSTPPNAAGTCPAIAIASSRSAASMT